jgi:hypothetical protein
MDLKVLFFNAFASRPRPQAAQIIRPVVKDVEANQLRELLATRTSMELTDYELRTIVEGNLWRLTSEAFLYFLPAFLHAALKFYSSVSVFASELIGALTEPSRSDVVKALDEVSSRSKLGLSDDMTRLLRNQQLEWFDSGAPTAIFHERFDNLTDAEGVAILAFFVAFRKAHGADFPFGELDTAVDRYWARYRSVSSLPDQLQDEEQL